MNTTILDFLTQTIHLILSERGKETFSELNENMNLRSDLGLDSLDLAELTVRIEDEYNVDVFESGMVDTIGEIIGKIPA
jgi:acyl carrier protein